MSKRIISRDKKPFAQPGENTYGLEVIKEVWATDTGEKIYWKYSLPNMVQIFACTTDGKVIAISEFQPGVGTDYVHLPGETMEEGELPLHAARRGLLEETGYEAGSVKLLTSILENSGRSDRLIHFVFASDCVKSSQSAEEGISTILIDANDLWKRLMQFFLKNPEIKHGGSNTLKSAALGLHELGILP